MWCLFNALILWGELFIGRSYCFAHSIFTRFVCVLLSNRAFTLWFPEGVGSLMSKDIALSRNFLTSNPRAAAAWMSQWPGALVFWLVCGLVLCCWTVRPSMAYLVVIIAFISEYSLLLVSAQWAISWLIIGSPLGHSLTAGSAEGSGPAAVWAFVGVISTVLYRLLLLVSCGSHLVLTTLDVWYKPFEGFWIILREVG